MSQREVAVILVAGKPCFGLQIACPVCLPLYIYLRFANLHFHLDSNLIFPDSVQIPYVENGDYVTYNNERDGVIESLKEEGIVDLDSEIHSSAERSSTKEMVSSWLADAITYELWLGIDGNSAQKIYNRANLAYGALSSRLGDQNFLFENRPSSLDALVLGHILFTLLVLPEISVLAHANLVRYAEKFMELETGPSQSSFLQFNSDPSSSAPRRCPF